MANDTKVDALFPNGMPTVEEVIARLETLPRVDLQLNPVTTGPIEGMDIPLCPRSDCNCRRRYS